jgi:hypothetical protein
MTAIFGLALAWAIATPDAPTICSPMQQRSLRPRAVLELLLRATPDSLPDGNRPTASAGETDHQVRLAWDTVSVYAQVFELVRVDGDLGPLRLRRYRRVALVWWRLGQSCQRVTPKPAVQSDIDELFLLARPVGNGFADTAAFVAIVADLRPESQWIQRMPTFDISDGSWLYSPRHRRPVNLPNTIQGALTVAEYRDFFAHLPIAGTSYDEMSASWRGLLRWGEAEPRRWALYPAALELCAAERNLGDSTRSRGRCGQ